jgi:hypothetical protein
MWHKDYLNQGTKIIEMNPHLMISESWMRSIKKMSWNQIFFDKSNSLHQRTKECEYHHTHTLAILFWNQSP